MLWLYVRRYAAAFPKIALAVAVILISTIAFVIWLISFKARKAEPARIAEVEKVILPKIQKIEENPGRFVLVDNTLVDIERAEVVFTSWLKYGVPQRLFWKEKEHKFLAAYERGFVRYDFKGAVEAELNQPPSTVADDMKWAVLCRNGDVYRTDLDWEKMSRLNEKKITAIGQFNDQYFAANLLIGTERTLILRNVNKIANVNLQTGTVKPMDLSLEQLSKRKSPDSKRVVGLEKGQFYCYEVDADRPLYHPVGRGAINDYLWLGNEKCVAIAAMKTVVVYDVPKNTLTVLAELPAACNRIGEPSPDQRYFFCAGKSQGFLIDAEKRTVLPVVGGAGVKWISNDTFTFSREIMDSDQRGTWVQTVGEPEKRVLTEPFLVGKVGGLVMTVPSKEWLVFATKRGLARMRSNGGEAAEILALPHPPQQAVGIETWDF
jgi:hypothetical protein